MKRDLQRYFLCPASKEKMDRVVKNLAVFFLMVLVTFSQFAHADLWDRQVEEKFTETYEYGGETYDHGYAYRAGAGFSRPEKARDIVLDYEYNLGLGCGGFDLAADFLHGLNEEALKDYISAMGSSALQAAPLLLLEYISPTLADTLKHIKSQMREIQLLKYYQCQDIEDAGSNWIRKMKESGRGEQLRKAQQEGKSLSETMGDITQSSPLKGKLDYYGKPLGTMRLVRDGLKWIEADEEMIELGPEVTGDYKISYNAAKDKSDVVFIAPAKRTHALLTENANQFKDDLQTAMDYYDKTGKVKESDLKKLSLPSVAITPTIIKAIGILPPFERYVSGTKLVGALALSKTVWELTYIIESLQQAAHNPYLDEGQIMKLAEFTQDLDKNRSRLLAESQEDTVVAKKITDGILAGYSALRSDAAAKEEDAKSAEESRLEKMKQESDSRFGGLLW